MRTTTSYFGFAPLGRPSPKDKNNASPPPDPKGWSCSGGFPVGMATGKISVGMSKGIIYIYVLDTSCRPLQENLLRDEPLEK